MQAVAVVIRQNSMTNEDGVVQGQTESLPWLQWVLLAIAVAFYGLCFVHLKADFPNYSPWNDWSKMTDEGWYSGAAIQHFVQGEWFIPGSFNPAVAMPIWPLMLGIWFECTGLGMVSARVLTLVLYAASLVLLYMLVRERFPKKMGGGLLPALAVAVMAINPFCYAFDRLAILEPVVVLWMMLGLWIAGRTRRDDVARQVGLGVVLFLLVLTKTTGIFLGPAVLFHLVATLNWRGWVRTCVVAAGTAIVLWMSYYLLVVKPHYLEDYRILFTINQYRVHLSIVPKVAFQTLWDGMWINRILFPAALIVLLLSLTWMRELWRVPLFGSSVVAVVGYLSFICYHSNLQPRYYLVVTMPVVAVLVLGLESLWARQWQLGAVMAGAIGIALVTMMIQTVRYVMHPEYSLASAADAIAVQMRGDPNAKQILVSTSGADITLLTGLPSLCPVYNTHDPNAVMDRYQPGWYAGWVGWEDDLTSTMRARYRLNEKARYRIFDDPSRQVLVLYRIESR